MPHSHSKGDQPGKRRTSFLEVCSKHSILSKTRSKDDLEALVEDEEEEEEKEEEEGGKEGGKEGEAVGKQEVAGNS